jgi:hypothetical protein
MTVTPTTPALTTDDDDSILTELRTKHGLPPTATLDEIEAAQHASRCQRHGFDPATTTWEQVSEHVSVLIAARSAKAA